MLQTAQAFGGALGVAVLGSVGAAGYTNSAALEASAGVPSAALERARETVGGALESAVQLPEAAAGALVAAARTAFTDELHAAALTGGVVMVLARVFSLVAPKSVKHDAHEETALNAGVTSTGVRTNIAEMASAGDSGRSGEGRPSVPATEHRRRPATCRPRPCHLPSSAPPPHPALPGGRPGAPPPGHRCVLSRPRRGADKGTAGVAWGTTGPPS
ncbi:hypothetical protein ABZZ79_06990 [Streptomyces sp. NPDC006458]|uniref:hypothetical protein n=1 Tax=Streptomyces sp. NPDC006458 TaxID=3154302 RepID=UPI0033B11496